MTSSSALALVYLTARGDKAQISVLQSVTYLDRISIICCTTSPPDYVYVFQLSVNLSILLALKWTLKLHTQWETSSEFAWAIEYSLSWERLQSSKQSTSHRPVRRSALVQRGTSYATWSTHAILPHIVLQMASRWTRIYKCLIITSSHMRLALNSG